MMSTVGDIDEEDLTHRPDPMTLSKKNST